MMRTRLCHALLVVLSIVMSAPMPAMALGRTGDCQTTACCCSGSPSAPMPAVGQTPAALCHGTMATQTCCQSSQPDQQLHRAIHSCHNRLLAGPMGSGWTAGDTPPLPPGLPPRANNGVSTAISVKIPIYLQTASLLY